MVRRGFTVLMLGIACYVLAIASQIGWLYLFAALIWGSGVTSILLARMSLRSIELSRVVLASKKAHPWVNVPGISEDDDLEIGIMIRNSSRFPKYLLKIVESCPLEKPGKQAKSFFLTSLGSRESVTATYQVKCYRRGQFTFPSVAVEAVSPFGIFKLRKEFPAPLSVLVYPACYPLVRLPLASDTLSNSGTRFNVRAGNLFCGSREYQRGDSLRHIHWRNSARWDRLMVKEFEESFRSSLVITFNAGSNFGRGKESTLEYAIKIAASVTRYCTSRGMRVHLLPSHASSKLKGSSFLSIMDFLAKLQPKDKTNLNELLDMPRVPYPTLAIVSLADSRLLDTLRELGAKTRQLIVVALSGFVRQELPGEALAGLGMRDVIICRRGELPTALKELQSIGCPAASPAQEVCLG